MQLIHWEQDFASKVSADNLLGRFHCAICWRNRCIWPHTGGSKDLGFEEVKFEAIKGSYLYQNDIESWELSLYHRHRTSLEKRKGTHFALLNIYHTKSFWCGSHFWHLYPAPLSTKECLHSLLSAYFVDKMAHFRLVDWCVTWFLLSFPRCSPPCKQLHMYVAGKGKDLS